jgi:ATP-dependent DNA ligase
MPFEALEVKPGLPPMEAKLVDALPEGEGWRYEPKWDGFRCLVFRDGDAVELQSKAGRPLGRYFPEVVAAVAALKPGRFVVDGELVISRGDRLDFEALQLRLHPAESRIRKLAAETPAQLMLFDCLTDPGGRSLLGQPLTAVGTRLKPSMPASRSPLCCSPRTRGAHAARTGSARPARRSTASSPSGGTDFTNPASARC